MVNYTRIRKEVKNIANFDNVMTFTAKDIISISYCVITLADYYTEAELYTFDNGLLKFDEPNTQFFRRLLKREVKAIKTGDYYKFGKRISTKLIIYV